MNGPWIVCALCMQAIGTSPASTVSDGDHGAWVIGDLRPRLIQIARDHGDKSGFSAPATLPFLQIAAKHVSPAPRPRPARVNPKVGSLLVSTISNKEHWAWFWNQYRSVQAVRPGMTRASILKVVAEQGGLSTRSRQTFTARGCPYIQVNLVFTTKGTKPEMDTVASTSAIHLDYAVSD